jgi:hypothetical protein
MLQNNTPKAVLVENEKSDTVRQIMLRSEHVFMCLLRNRTHNHIRVIDFRTGNFPMKKVFINSVVQEEKAHKVFTLIERDEVSGWQRLGFTKEGTIPGFYKRSDAYVMSKVYEDIAPPDETAIDDKLIVQNAKKLGKELSEIKGPACRIRVIDVDEALKIRKKGPRDRTRLTSFDPFGRHGDRLFLHATTRRGGHENVLSAEYQDCFGNAHFELLFAPNTQAELAVAYAGLQQILTVLGDRGVVSVFALARVDQTMLNGLYAAAGFRRTGLLQHQTREKDKYVDALLWSRKLPTLGGGAEDM